MDAYTVDQVKKASVELACLVEAAPEENRDFLLEKLDSLLGALALTAEVPHNLAIWGMPPHPDDSPDDPYARMGLAFEIYPVERG